MRKLIMWNVITLDGYFEGEKAWDLDFHQTVWGDELERFSIEQLDTADALIFGKATYTGMFSHFSEEKDDVADRMNHIKKYVCSSKLTTADWSNTTVIKDAAAEITKLKDQGKGNLFVFGSAVLSNSLMNAGLFDEYRLCVAPVILGEGRKLFDSGLPHQELNLLKATQLLSGGVILRYGRKE